MSSKKLQILSSTGLLSYNPQKLTDEQKARARENIDAGNKTDFDALKNKIDDIKIPTKLGDLINDQGYLTAVPGEYITEEELMSKGYLTEHQSLTDYAKTADLGNLATKDVVTKSDMSADVKELLNKADSALQSYTETDPTVPSWAKADKKPTYTASEVGALPSTTKIPSKLSDLTDDSTHRTVTDTEKSTWSAKVDTSSLTSAVNDALLQAKASGEFDGESGVYVGSGEMPEGYNVQIDPNGDADIEVLTAEETKNLVVEEVANNLPFVTPQMYGAKGDGVTDDTEAFENALAENDDVYVPSGNYLISRGLNLTYKKSLFSNDGQRATLLFNGSGSIVNLGRLSVFRNINIRIENAFVGTVFNTHNHLVDSGQSALESRVEDVNVFFEVASPDATLIGITVDSGTDPNNMPRLKGVCYQTYHDICVEYGSNTYGYGIRMELIENRQFTEETKTGFPWITHIDYDDVFLGSPHTAIKAGVVTADGVEHFERVDMGHLLFNNVSTQYRNAESTKIFFDLNHFSGFFTKCIGWDYHPLTWAGEKVNIIGKDVRICVTDSQMAFGADFMKCCDFTAETEFTVDDNPEYFINKYFPGTVLSQGYDSIDAKIAAKLTGEYVANIAEERINDILYSGYANVLDDPLTQIKVKQRWSSSSNAWIEGETGSTKKTTVIIPIAKGGNVIRWTPSTYNSDGSYDSIYFFNDDGLTDGISAGKLFLNSMTTDGYTNRVDIDNPNGYKYVSLPFSYYTDISAETMTMTINREITGNEGKSYTEHLKESIIDPAVSAKVSEEIGKLDIPTKTSQLENDSGFLIRHQSLEAYAKKTELPTKTSQLTNDSGFITAEDIPETQVPDLSGYALKSSAETWTFTLADGSTVTKKVVLA